MSSGNSWDSQSPSLAHVGQPDLWPFREKFESQCAPISFYMTGDLVESNSIRVSLDRLLEALVELSTHLRA